MLKNNKSSVSNTVTLAQILEFEVVFPNEERLTIQQYLAGCSREKILNAAAFFLGFKNHKSKFENNREFLGMFFQAENSDFAYDVYSRIRELEKKNIRIGIINTYSSLRLFEYYFSKTEEPQTQTEVQLEVNLFKAYLALNSEFTSKQSTAFSSSENSDKELQFAMIMFCMQYPLSDKVNYDIHQIWATQMIKAIYLFQFLETAQIAQPLLTAFVAYFNCTSWQEYLKRLLPLTHSAIKNAREAHTDIVVKQGENFELSCAFIEKIIIQEKDELDQNDFLSTRAKPFYKVKDGVYRIIFNLFVVEKIFKGVYFLLRDVNKVLPIAQRIKDVRSFYGNEFSEKVLCYKVMESIYPDRCIRFSGKQMDDMKIDAAPDYYIRKGNNMLIIESKDFLISADKKMSFDYNVYEEEFGRVLDYEELPCGKIKAKAVMQLINSIRRLLKNDFIADTDYYYKDVFIYPVLLTHDHQYDTPGFNELIDFWFQDALSELAEEGLFTHHVKPLSVVNIDSLIYHQMGLASEIPLHEILKLYHESKKLERPKKKILKSQKEYDRYLDNQKEMLMSKLIPFSLFINNCFESRGLWKSPPLLDLIAPALFKEEYENKVRTS
ncbi:hypothetical protein [Sphingobacterium arenae]|uniref:NERD domain-containing protein n=1 Tax=Sphingobacterium arenae TaxID=1280598 RepID=A0ABR7Y2Y9_9SPHI|nr:hypothetical protein [Sphingobacterium arenae]MBD1425667.1 hypothetical protein [Sphingobacterium arenae]